MIRVAIADDHAIVRRGLKEILAGEPDMRVGGEAADAQELFHLLDRKVCDVVVLDITMPGKSGLEVLKELKQDRPRLPVLVLTMHAEDQFGVRAIRAGAVGYLTKESAPSELIRAIRKTMAGERYISPSLAEKLSGTVGVDMERPVHQMLSDREYEVLRLLASGKPSGAIGRRLKLSVKTISTYRGRILEKMGMKNNAELIRYAIRNHLAD